MTHQILLVDCPWKYGNNKTGGERKNKAKKLGGCAKHYNTMSDQALKDMKPFIESLSDSNCALFLWATYPKLDVAIEVLKYWGFRYVTVVFTWVKRSKKSDKITYGPGHYTGSNPEIVLLGIKGKMKPNVGMTPSVVIEPRQEHSRKPDEVHRRIEKMYPDAKKIELFARRPIEGWDVWGNEIKCNG